MTQLVKICLQCGRPGFDPWVGKIPWRRERLPTPLFWPGEFHGLYSLWHRKELDMTEWLSLSLSIKLAGKWATAPHDPLALISDNEKWRQIFQSWSVLPQLLFLSPLFFNVWSGDFSLTFFFLIPSGFYFLFINFLPSHSACEIQVPQSGIEPTLPALEALEAWCFNY